MRTSKTLWAVMAVVPLLFSAGEALAWTPIDGSLPVWQNLPHTYYVNQGTIPGPISADGVASIDAGFAQWMSPSCTSYTAQNLGNTTSGASYNDGKNVLRWISNNWPSMYGPVNSVIGVTLPVFFNGPITDADISFNNVGFCWNNTGTGGCVDTKSIATHEEGHALGLGHSNTQGATMYASYGGGTSIATIEADDINGVCTLYPGNGTTSASSSSSSVASSSSSSGGGMTCMDCTQYQSGGACASQYNTCTGSQSCVNFYNCAINCGGNQTCVQNCANMYPTGAQQYGAFRDCICGVCVTECAMECGGGTTSSSTAASTTASSTTSTATGAGGATATAAGVGGGATTGGWGGSDGEGGGGPAADPGSDSGCGCRIQNRAHGPGALLLVMALGAAAARKRQSRRRRF